MFKRLISMLLCTAVLMTCVLCAAPVSFAAEDAADIPVVHVLGTGSTIYRYNEAGEKEILYPVQIPENYINEKAKVFLPVFAKAFFTQQWDEFCDVLYECISPLFSKMGLDKNGEASDGSTVDWSWSREELKDKQKNGKYKINDYEFNYDWRLDPLTTADKLHQYIEDVLYVTGAEKVALYGRCLGSNIVAAYMQKYDGEYVSDVIHYCSAVYGATQCSKAFTGELYLHSDGINRYIYDINLDVDDCVMDFLRAFVTLLNKTYGLDLACWAVNNVFKDIYLDIMPRVLIESYGTFPAYWSMVSIDDYSRAMETVFYGSDTSEYSKLIEKVENYHNSVQLKFAENTKAQAARGIEFSNIVKYGLQSIPVTENSDEASDSLVTVRESSFGATAALVGKTLSREYIEKARANGTEKYISPDKQIDASTCLSPDTTWFIKNLNHVYFPKCVNGLVSEIVNNKGFTVNSSAEYPQYLVFNGETKTISPMTAENMNTTERWNVSFFKALSNLLKSVFEMIKQKALELGK